MEIVDRTGWERKPGYKYPVEKWIARMEKVPANKVLKLRRGSEYEIMTISMKRYLDRVFSEMELPIHVAVREDEDAVGLMWEVDDG